MKSFAAKTRDALTREDAPHMDSGAARRAELTGLILACGTVSLLGGGQVSLLLRTEHPGTGRWIVRLLRREFAIMPGLRIHKAERLGGRETIEARVEGDEGARVLGALGLTPLSQSIPKACMKSGRGRDAFLRGLFLGCGTLPEPERGYQLEFGLGSEKLAQSLIRFLRTFYGVQGGLNRRRGAAVVYLRDSEGIMTVLSHIGAYSAILELENIRITRDARNRANRAANCDSGNIAKMLGAADRHLRAIQRIERTIGLEALPDVLREVAVLRKEHADVSLEALGEMLEPPVGKSGVNHRLARIEAIARNLEEPK